MRIPNKLDRQIDKLYELQREIAGATLALHQSVEYKMLEKLKINYQELEQALLANHIEVLKSTTGKQAQLTVTEKINYRITDWNDFSNYVILNDAYDLFQRRIAPSAVQAREEEGEKVLGLEKYTHITIKPKQL